VSHAMCRVEVHRNRVHAQIWVWSIEAHCTRMSALPVLTGGLKRMLCLRWVELGHVMWEVNFG
jgi:hypothetical protein